MCRWPGANAVEFRGIGILNGRAPSIFVSYRVADTLPTADRLAAELQREFGGPEVFFDRRTIETGEMWDSRIQAAVKGAKVVLVLIGKKWLTVQNDYGRRRLDIPGDWVRHEVEEALAIPGRVLPVLVDDAAQPPAAALADLPTIAGLASCQAAKLRTRDWDTDFRALVDLLASKGLVTRTDAKPATSPGRIANQQPQLAERLASYQHAVQQEWQDHWSDDAAGDAADDAADDAAGNKPPFIATQGLRLLLETERPERYLHPEYFRVGRGARSTTTEQDLGDWAEVDRAELVASRAAVEDESPLHLSRFVITTDAGVGKTTTMQWLAAEFNRPGAATVAFYLTFSRMPAHLDEFTPEQQERFLGSDRRGRNRLRMIPAEAHEILSTPRVLSYLRDLPDADLKKIRTAGDVYWHAIEHLLVAGMQGSREARRIGLDGSEPIPEKVQARSKLRSLEVLAAIGFEMTSTRIPGGAGPQGETPATPNFDGVPRNLFRRFRKRLQRRLAAHASLDRDLDGLAALNEFISQGFFDTTVDGLQEVYWRNRSLQEFLQPSGWRSTAPPTMRHSFGTGFTRPTGPRRKSITGSGVFSARCTRTGRIPNRGSARSSRSIDPATAPLRARDDRANSFITPGRRC